MAGRSGRGIMVLSFLLALAAPRWACALSLYDVVQLVRSGYTDEQILHLIAVTDSRFRVDAQTLVTLKDEGVSEPVIQAILAAKDTEAQEESPAAEEEEPAGSPPDLDRPGPPTVEAGRRQEETTAAGVFTAVPFVEETSSHGGHQHFAVAVRGVPVLILRSEGGYGTVALRAEGVTQRLNALGLSPAGRFVGVAGPPATVSYRGGGTASAVQVLPVQGGDVIAYQRQSLGVVSAARLASYWAAALNDYTQLFVFHRRPTELAGLHLGETLLSIYDGLAAGDAQSQRAGNRDDALLGLLDHLAAEDKEHLIELTTRVPAEFSPR